MLPISFKTFQMNLTPLLEEKDQAHNWVILTQYTNTVFYYTNTVFYLFIFISK